ncbi:hypothetical protein MPTK1_7g03100 [Marchantia polymorpha subsp. ruderalis]|uniref:Uncharacterized protein n=2 Tax=Marchantia polymorpha TaxID=3197 RepID=A0AAF6BVL7_MARPO|nr:hypothetical protein MARPO_0074s0086 [Marchantia polymorpha]BBN16051.1 hypothetical protein Mp_7g03100 [Marchantia polymorpha subsp. ruderalis]|eukprot:PTQ35114.1 hypothetical protein MARPO_0074s0086 [Marchantia polymorpha]
MPSHLSISMASRAGLIGLEKRKNLARPWMTLEPGSQQASKSVSEESEVRCSSIGKASSARERAINASGIKGWKIPTFEPWAQTRVHVFCMHVGMEILQIDSQHQSSEKYGAKSEDQLRNPHTNPVPQFSRSGYGHSSRDLPL